MDSTTPTYCGVVSSAEEDRYCSCGRRTFDHSETDDAINSLRHLIHHRAQLNYNVCEGVCVVCVCGGGVHGVWVVCGVGVGVHGV